MRIPMCEPDITAAEREAVDEVLRGTTLSIGPRLELFERRIAAYVGARHAAAQRNFGNDGSELLLLVGKGREPLLVEGRHDFSGNDGVDAHMVRKKFDGPFARERQNGAFCRDVAGSAALARYGRLACDIDD